MRKYLNRYLPPGQNMSGWLIVFGVGLFFAFIFNFTFVGVYNACLNNAFWGVEALQALTPAGFMPDFTLMIQGRGIGFRILHNIALVMALGCYVSFRHESKSIYLMKRLPDRRELWRRVWGVPLLMLAVITLTNLLLILIYFGFYLLITPAELLQPMQWQKLWAEPWRILLCYY